MSRIQWKRASGSSWVCVRASRSISDRKIAPPRPTIIQVITRKSLTGVTPCITAAPARIARSGTTGCCCIALLTTRSKQVAGGSLADDGGRARDVRSCAAWLEAEGPGERARLRHPARYSRSVEGGDRLDEMRSRAQRLPARHEPTNQLQPSQRRLERRARRLERLQGPAQMSLAGLRIARGASGAAGGALGQAEVEGAALLLRQLGRASRQLQTAGGIPGEHVSLGEKRQ